MQSPHRQGNMAGSECTPPPVYYGDDDDLPLGAGLGGQLPRRNHTVSAGSLLGKAKRLAQHFEQPMPPNAQSRPGIGPNLAAFAQENAASPGRNSLREITGHDDGEHDDWERALQDERHSAAEHLAGLSDPAVSLSSVSATPSASSNAATVRRHQSLNHHLGRSIASRLAASPRISDQPSFGVVEPTSPPASSSQLHNALGSADPHELAGPKYAGQPIGNKPDGSPASPTSHFRSTEGSGTHSPSRYAHTFGPNLGHVAGGSSPVRSSAKPHGLGGSVDAGRGVGEFSASGLEALRTSLTSLDLRDGMPSGSTLHAHSSSVAGGQERSSDTPSHDPSKRLPSLVTDPNLLAQSNTPRQQTTAWNTRSSALPGHSRHASLSSAHSRMQSTAEAFSTGGVGRSDPLGLLSPQPPNPQDALGPRTAAPQSNWGDKERVAGAAASVRALASPPLPHEGQLHASLSPGPHQQGQQLGDMPPSQWGLALSPTANRGDRDQVKYALSMALAEQQQKTAMLEAALRANAGVVDPNSRNNRPTHRPSASWHQQLHYMQGPVTPSQAPPPVPQSLSNVQGSRAFGDGPSSIAKAGRETAADGSIPLQPEAAALHERLKLNPVSFELSPPSTTRFCVIKSFTEDDIHRSIRHGIWASTDKGNQRLQRVYAQCQKEAQEQGEPALVYLFFSVNGSGRFCGLAEMASAVDFNTDSNVWAQEGKWKGTFQVKHIFVKDVPNRELRHIKLPNNPENKSVTQSRDTQELDRESGLEILRIMHSYPARTSILQNLSSENGQQAPISRGPAQTPAPPQRQPLMNGALSQAPPVGFRLQDAPTAAAGPNHGSPYPVQNFAQQQRPPTNFQRPPGVPPGNALGGAMPPPIHLGFDGPPRQGQRPAISPGQSYR